jgi:hypothetical protein
MRAVGFLSTRVERQDEDDYEKLARVIRYLRGTANLVLRLFASRSGTLPMMMKPTTRIMTKPTPRTLKVQILLMTMTKVTIMQMASALRVSGLITQHNSKKFQEGNPRRGNPRNGNPRSGRGDDVERGMDAQHGHRTSDYHLRPRKARDYSHLFVTRDLYISTFKVLFLRCVGCLYASCCISTKTGTTTSRKRCFLLNSSLSTVEDGRQTTTFHGCNICNDKSKCCAILSSTRR